LFEASKELHRIGLNINASKVKEFSSRDDFNYHWAFSLFALLADPENVANVEQAARDSIAQTCNSSPGSQARPWRSSSVLKRIISVGVDKLEPKTREDFLSIIIKLDDLPRWDAWVFEKLFRSFDTRAQSNLVEAIELRIPEIQFNSFYLNILKFYKKCRTNQSLDHITQRIDELSFR